MNNLHDSFKSIIFSEDDDFTEIRSSVKCLNDIDVLISKFSKKAEMSWIVRSSKPHETTYCNNFETNNNKSSSTFYLKLF